MQPDIIRGEEDPWAFDGGSEPSYADVLIITHPSFAEALDSLVALRRSQGLSVAVVNVLGVYDVWGDGRPDPEAIRAFMGHFEMCE